MARIMVRTVVAVVAIGLMAGCPHRQRAEPDYDDGSVKNPEPGRVMTAAELQEIGDFEVVEVAPVQ